MDGATHMTTDDRIEQIARIIFERAFDRDDGKPKPTWTPGGNSFKQDDARAIARQIDALPCKGGEAKPALHIDDINDPVLRGLANLEDGQCWMCLTKNGLHAPECSDATPTTEADTGRGLREALEAIADPNLRHGHGRIARQALAALSDQPQQEKQA